MPDFLKPYISRFAATIIASFVAWLASKSISINADTQQQAISAIVGVASVVFGIIYSLFHKIIDKFVNPGDGAAQANIISGHAIKKAAE